MALTAAQERKKRAHKGQDCWSVRLNGTHVHYSCMTHLFIVISDLAQGDDTVWVDTWSIPAYLIDSNNKIKCVYHDR